MSWGRSGEAHRLRNEQARRIVYGARCVWWDSIDKVATLPSGLPCCPHCGSVLFETTLKDWDAGITKHVEASGDVEYRALMTWMRGRCFPSFDAAKAAYAKRANA